MIIFSICYLSSVNRIESSVSVRRLFLEPSMPSDLVCFSWVCLGLVDSLVWTTGVEVKVMFKVWVGREVRVAV